MTMIAQPKKQQYFSHCQPVRMINLLATTASALILSKGATALQTVTTKATNLGVGKSELTNPTKASLLPRPETTPTPRA